ncbi:kinase-like domain-containing protein [Dactylonectria macrodidyma]|uniref:Kinase-like domain-containing protein n=1 Tax=Dactylonectria macrodidyma TaxID=307937 RepID=A0A9P9IXL0_9HYPO|nr:kinase-like domain-containing protein [Dactylonectria macrodidyma]
MSRAVYVIVYTSRLFPAHWALWIPSQGDSAIGKRVHATGDARAGFEVEFDRNYDIEHTGRQHQLVPLAQVHEIFINDVSCTVGPLSSECQPCDKIEEIALLVSAPSPSLVASSSNASSTSSSHDNTSELTYTGMNSSSSPGTTVFHESGFFRQLPKQTSLPPPSEIKQIAHQADAVRAQRLRRPPPVSIPSLGLLVKYGAEVSVAEAQCLMMIRERLSHRVPVPEVYGWCHHEGQAFIYMELVPGITLEQSWETLSERDRTAVCEELGGMVREWRGLARLDDSDPLIGHVGNQPLLDTIFTRASSPTAGPFHSVSEFHDWFTSTIGPKETHCSKTPHPYRSFLPDDVPIVFTHGDLHPSNIVISPGPNPKIAAVVDWQQAGWYPAYWEYCKARWTTRIGDEWERVYLPMFIERWEGSVYDYWDYFVLSRGV